MPAIHKYASPHSIETILSTELNSLVKDGAAIAVSPSIDNSSGLYKFADFETLTKQPLTLLDRHLLHLLESEDSSNYEDGVVSTGEVLLPAAQYIGNVRLIVNNSAYERHFIRSVPIPPTKFKIMFMNFSSGALAASGNTVRMIRYSEANV